jgi:hypothetical protein
MRSPRANIKALSIDILLISSSKSYYQTSPYSRTPPLRRQDYFCTPVKPHHQPHLIALLPGKMLSSLITASLLTALSIAHPTAQPQTTGSAPTVVATTNTTYYQGPPSASTDFCGEFAVGTGSMNQSYCYPLFTYSFALQALAEVECS